MKLLSFLLIAIAFQGIAIPDVFSAPATTSKRVVGYYTYWSPLAVKSINGNSLTHINYAFANIDTYTLKAVVGNPSTDTDKVFGVQDECSCCAKGNYNQLYQLRKEFPHLQTLLSIGGATWSGSFAAATATASARSNLAASSIKILTDYGFDGLDFDWEFPQDTTSANNFLLFLQEVRRQLNLLSDGSRYYITIASSADQDTLARMNLGSMASTLDWFNIMAYDMSIGFTKARHQAPLYASTNDPDPWPKSRYYIDHIVQQFLSAGVPSNKIVVGIPAYGHTMVTPAGDNNNHGLFQTQTCGADCEGSISYADIMNNKLQAGYVKYFDSAAQATYLYNPGTGGFVTYDDINSAVIKANYINKLNLGGAMFWEIGMDTMDSNSLITAVFKTLKGVNTAFRGVFCTKYSPFCNIKCASLQDGNELKGTRKEMTVYESGLEIIFAESHGDQVPITKKMRLEHDSVITIETTFESEEN